MHIVTKITLALGIVLLIGSAVAMVVGGGSFMGDFVENPSGTEKWSGTSPTTYEGEFQMMAIYYVFVEDGSTVDVELVDGDQDSRFMPCEEDQSCNLINTAGYTYVGDISVFVDGTWQVAFTGDGDVMIREQTIDLGGFLGAIGGFTGICCSFCVLGLGVIFIFTLKSSPKQQLMVVQQDGTIQQVAGAPTAGAAPAAQGVNPAHMVGGQIHPSYQDQYQQTAPPPQQGTILPPVGGQQPPNQGF
uniref:Uncharacterized protein n=2 Tax=environmental samples TaxID=68359 RepID=A0A075GH73_9EURY|nr:hypothetical protein [uncultured marine group II/III euryarchaeote AD1000_105_G07]AIF00923.1 hypothetical protein [uncultured marine group II/III euryarchaeote KM3_13_G01]